MTLKLETKKIAQLKGYEKNARKHPIEQIQQIAASIKEFGFLSPVLIDKKGNITCGHGRVAAAKTLGIEEVPCLVADHLTEAQRRAFILIENRLHESGGASWDADLLRQELDDLMLNLQVDLSPLGFSPDEINALLTPAFVPDLGDDDDDTDDDDKEKTFKLVITCKNDSEQQDLFDELIGRGLKVKVG